MPPTSKLTSYLLTQISKSLQPTVNFENRKILNAKLYSSSFETGFVKGKRISIDNNNALRLINLDNDVVIKLDFDGSIVASSITATTFSGSGASLTNLNAANITAGILPVARGGTNSGTALSGSTIMVSNGTNIIQGSAGTTVTVLHGNASGLPTYAAVSLTADISGILPIANGGTNANTFANNTGAVYFDGTRLVTRVQSTITAAGFQAVGLGVGIFFDGDSDTGFAGVANTSVDGFINNVETFAFSNPGSSTSVSSIYVRHNATLKQVKTKTDGAGDYLLYVSP